jgi:hypothetical protein
VDLCARMAAECLSRVMGKARSSWLGSIPSLDETVHAASTRKNQLQDAFKWHVKPARGNLCVQCERHTETAVRMFIELWRFPASGLPRFDPCAEHKPLPHQRFQEQRNSGDHGGTGRLHDRIHVTARRFVAAVEENAGCKSGHALAAGLKWVGDGSDWEACFEDRQR